MHVLDAAHFALDTAADEIAALVRGLLGSYRPVNTHEVMEMKRQSFRRS